MGNLIDEVAKLKELNGRRQAIIDRQKETANPNHALLERLEIEHDILNAVPELLDAMGMILAGDASLLSRMIATHRCPNESDPDTEYLPCASCLEEREIMRRYRDMAKKMGAER